MNKLIILVLLLGAAVGGHAFCYNYKTNGWDYEGTINYVVNGHNAGKYCKCVGFNVQDCKTCSVFEEVFDGVKKFGNLECECKSADNVQCHSVAVQHKRILEVAPEQKQVTDLNTKIKSVMDFLAKQEK